MKRNRKGFTIVELVIVIAVIAILAAVLIPTFSSLIQKANLSADEQAVRSMNTALMADEAINGKPSNLGEARAVLAAAGYNAESYHPISAGHNFYWDAELNCILLVKGSRETQEVVYPTEYAGAGEDFFANDTRRYNLFDGWTLGDETIVAEVDAGVTRTRPARKNSRISSASARFRARRLTAERLRWRKTRPMTLRILPSRRPSSSSRGRSTATAPRSKGSISPPCTERTATAAFTSITMTPNRAFRNQNTAWGSLIIWERAD